MLRWSTGDAEVDDVVLALQAADELEAALEENVTVYRIVECELGDFVEGQ